MYILEKRFYFTDVVSRGDDGGVWGVAGGGAEYIFMEFQAEIYFFR